jgi:UDP-2,3-diacylglucosamine pyrophosphatase LpxH
MPVSNLLVVSDLHLNAGFDPETGKTSRLEDFFRDDSFARFLRYHEEARDQPRFGGRPWQLILNGDIFDFLQVVSLPQEGLPLCTVKGVDQRSDLTSNERTYGLGTTALESEWKLKQIAKGHQGFFAALGWFVARGNRVAIVRGNHDIELHWEEVQERFVVEAKRADTRRWVREGGDPPAAPDACFERIRFYPWFYHEPERVYVEHGCQYDAANHFRDFLNPVLPDDPKRIELPWGSLFVRYLFNEVEDIHPFADNVKPLTRYLGWAFRKHPFKTLEVLVRRGWVFLKAFWMTGQKATASALNPSDREESDDDRVPLPAEIAAKIQTLARQRVASSWQTWLGSLLHGLISLLTLFIIAAFLGLAGVTLFLNGGPRWMAGVYVGAAIFAALLRSGLSRSFSQMMDGHGLMDVAYELEQILAPTHAVHVIAMGHDHDPTIERLEETWYVNTGAWVPIYEKEGPVEGREALTFLRMRWDHEGPPELLRWDDGGGAPARMVVWEDDGLVHW